jgi:endonuclease YncB( thermonuclease family)/lysophospholipase L1-like esterase
MFGQDALLLGHLVFGVPPLAIRIRKGNITFRWKPLRTKESIAVKSGNAEAYIEVDLAFVGLRQISDSLGGLIALWKKFPFVPIENAHIRRMMLPHAPDDTMAVCLETLVMDAVAGKPDQVMATLILRWFNYKPFSNNFLFRREWRSLNAPSDEVRLTDYRGGEVVSSEGSGVGVGGSVMSTTNEPPGSIVDLSVIDEPTILQQSLPPEVRIASVSARDPSDPYIAPTYPVVYPFNSVPFMDRVNSGEDSAVRLTSWNDQMTMSWNSFTRVPVPVNWRYELIRTGEMVPPTGDRPGEPSPVGRSNEVSPVTGNRDTLLWIGDSIMHGVTGVGEGMNGGDPRLHQWGNWLQEERNQLSRGFRYYCIAKDGIRTQALRTAWNQLKSDSALKRSSNCDRVAAVIIHIGTNNVVSNDETLNRMISDIREIANEANQFGAIVVLLPLAPEGDDGSTENPQYPDAAQAYLDRASRAIDSLAGSLQRGMFINYHPSVVDARYSHTYNAPWMYDFRRDHILGLHPTPNGYNAMGRYILERLPWGSIRSTQAADEWTIFEVEDGDSAKARRGSEERILRFVGMDTPETYGRHNANGGRGPSGSGSYTQTQLNGWLPNGQDSWRPAANQWGEKARAELSRLVLNRSVRIEWKGERDGGVPEQDRYGRYLVVVHAGETNVNEHMVRQGFARSFLIELGSDEGQPFAQAEAEARGRPTDALGRGGTPIGIWAEREVALVTPDPTFDGAGPMPDEVRRSLTMLQSPSDWRQWYPVVDDGTGGH